MKKREDTSAQLHNSYISNDQKWTEKAQPKQPRFLKSTRIKTRFILFNQTWKIKPPWKSTLAISGCTGKKTPPHWKPFCLRLSHIRHFISTEQMLFFSSVEIYYFWQDVPASHCHSYRGQLCKEAIREAVDSEEGKAEEKCRVRKETWREGDEERAGGGQKELVRVTRVKAAVFNFAGLSEKSVRFRIKCAGHLECTQTIARFLFTCHRSLGDVPCWLLLLLSLCLHNGVRSGSQGALFLPLSLSNYSPLPFLTTVKINRRLLVSDRLLTYCLPQFFHSSHDHWSKLAIIKKKILTLHMFILCLKSCSMCFL